MPIGAERSGRYAASGEHVGAGLANRRRQEGIMQLKSDCPKCKKQMQEGVTLDRTAYRSAWPSLWIEGPVENGWLGNIKLRGKKTIDITTYRCFSCGYLESYAPQA